MSIDISPKNVDRLKATAQAEGVSVDTYVERMMNEREEIAAIVERANARKTLSPEEACAKIERGYKQSEHGDVADGETFASGLFAEFDELEQKRRAG